MRKNILKSTVMASLIMLVCLQSNAQLPVMLWDKTIGGNYADAPGSIYPAADGGWFLFGTSNSLIGHEKSAAPYTLFGADIWVIKYNSSWVKEWDKVLGGTQDEKLGGVLRTPDGGFIIAATSFSDKSGDKSENARGASKSDYWVIKIDASGNKVWDKTYGGANDDELSSIQRHPWGGYILSGTSLSGKSGDKTHASFGFNDWWVICIDENGVQLWDKVFGGDRYDEAAGIFLDHDGFILNGRSDSNPSTGNKTAAKRGSYDAWMVKIDFSGNIIWDRAYGGDKNEKSASITKAHDGGYILSITSRSGISGDKTTPDFGADDAWFVKVDSNWVTQWDKTIGTVHQDQLMAIRASDGGYSLIGRHLTEEAIPGGGIIEHGERWLMHTDDKLVMNWEYKFGGDKNETVGGFWILEDDSTKIIIMSGSTSGIYGNKTESSRGGMDFWLTMIQMPFGLYSGIKSSEKVNNVSVFPNPVAGESVTFVSEETSIREVILYTLTGTRTLTTGIQNEKRVSMSVSQLPHGIYIARITTSDGKTINQKLIIQ